MPSDRRTFLAAASAASMAAAAAEPDWSAVRAEFPWAERQLFLNPAGWHPMRRKAIEAMQRYLDFKLNGPMDGRGRFATGQQDEAKQLFAQLINASPGEISFTQSTLMGENQVAAGLGIPGGKWNVVTDELHYEGSLYLYQSLAKQGLDLRIVKMKDGRIDIRDVEKAVNRKTRLIACSLVSYLNGYRADVKALSDLAHAHGGYVYADVIQSAGAVPIDVKALGLDFCACSGYKWLMGDRGLGFLYVREALHGSVMRRLQYGDRQFSNFQYHMYPHDPPGPRPASWKARAGAGSFYEVGNVANVVCAGHADNLKFVLGLGVPRIQAHAKPLVDKLRRELPRLGYPCLTPDGTPSPISSFIVERPDALRARLQKANIDLKVEWNQMRVSCSVYHNDADIDRLLNALS
ncbi:MAG: aminotransferase class V-fold PLP-dependent enzyme [Acidobacteria bacterium]|nr:aminotransferase class V-fold PLP-dependent enzyme [Acidobacteriota bacterium]